VFQLPFQYPAGEFWVNIKLGREKHLLKMQLSRLVKFLFLLVPPDLISKMNVPYNLFEQVLKLDPSLQHRFIVVMVSQVTLTFLCYF